MADPDFNLQSLHSSFQKAYEAVMSDNGSSLNDSGQKQATAFERQVKQIVPNDHLNNSIPCDEVTFHNPLCDPRFKKVPVTVIYQEAFLGEPPDLPIEVLQSPQSSNQSEIKIVQVWSMAAEKDSNSVDNSHQNFNLMEQVSQIIPADNSSNIDVSQRVQIQQSLVHSEAVAIRTNCEVKAHINKYVSNSSEKTTDIRAARLKRLRERKRKRYQTDPDYAERQRKRYRERQRERRKDAAYAERRRERQRERYRTDPAYAERERKRKRENLRKRCQTDPDYAERKNKCRRERQRERYQTDPAYAERERKRKREQRKHKKQHCQSVNSA